MIEISDEQYAEHLWEALLTGATTVELPDGCTVTVDYTEEASA